MNADPAIPEFLRNKGRSQEPPKPDSEEDIDLGPCVSRVSVKTFPGFQLRGVRVIGKGETKRRVTRVLNYSHIGFFELAEDRHTIALDVNEPDRWRITIVGTNLMKLLSGLNRNLIEWIEPRLGNAARFRPESAEKPNQEHVFIEDMTIERIENKGE